MVLKFVSVAIVAAVFGAASLQAQSIGDLRGPANLPPAGFKGQQFVDSRGCSFLKAGNGGQVMWVPRVGRDRRAMCGFPPSFGALPQIASAAEMAPVAEAPMVQEAPMVAEAAPAPRAEPAPTVYSAKPMETVASLTTMPTMRVAAPAATVPTALYVPAVPNAQPAPYAATAPRGTYEVASGAGTTGRKIGCYTSAPVAQRVKLRSGGTAVVCTRGDGTMTGWRPPVYADGSRVGASLSDNDFVTNDRGASGTTGYSNTGMDAGSGYVTAANTDRVPTPPAGYELAWKDDRLNPMRGKGTAQGDAQQDQIWTRKTPARLVADTPRAKRKKAGYATSGGNLTVSTKGMAADPVQAAPQTRVAKGGAFVQIGTFGVASNADGASSRLKSLGLPVARAKITSGGKPMQIVLAGPFASASDAQAALSMARGAGFGDAFIR